MHQHFSDFTVVQELESCWQDPLQSDLPEVMQPTKASPWEEACETARDAWSQVQDAMADGSQAKTSAH